MRNFVRGRRALALAAFVSLLADPGWAAIVEYVPEPGTFVGGVARYPNVVLYALDDVGTVIDRTDMFEVVTDFVDAGIFLDLAPPDFPGGVSVVSMRTDVGDAPPVTVTTRNLGLAITIDFAALSIIEVGFSSFGGDPNLRPNELASFFGNSALGPTHDFVVGGVRFQVTAEYQPYATAELQTDGSLLVSRIGASGQGSFQRFFDDEQGRPWRVEVECCDSLSFFNEPVQPIRFISSIPEPNSALLFLSGLMLMRWRLRSA